MCLNVYEVLSRLRLLSRGEALQRSSDVFCWALTGALTQGVKDWCLGFSQRSGSKDRQMFLLGPHRCSHTRCERLGFGFLSKARLSKGRRMFFSWARTGAHKV